MRTAKRYTNTTFTHRVDRDAGRKRPPRPPTEPRICVTCGAVYRHRRWILADAAALQLPAVVRGLEPATPTTCPGCRRAASRTPNGFLYLEGAFAAVHRDELLRLVEHEAARAAVDNPTARLIAVDSRGPRVTVTTTTEHLAQRLGHAIERAYDGTVRFDFSHENKLARVYWRRD